MELMALGQDSLKKDFINQPEVLKEGLISWISLKGLIEKIKAMTVRLQRMHQAQA